jgi:hypothetical protein
MLCNKELKTIHDEIISTSGITMVIEGSHDKIYPGYGSRFDNTEIDLVLCDDCIEKHFINKQTSDKKDN